MKRVVITGVGLVTPIGCGKENYWNAVIKGKSGIRKIKEFDVSEYRTQIAGIVDDFDAKNYLSLKEIDRMDRCSQFAIAVSEMAIEDAKLKINESNKCESGVIIGTGIGGIITCERQYENFYKKGYKAVSAFTIPMVMSNAAGSNISIKFGLEGPNFSVNTACSSGANAIGQSFNIIRSGYAKVMIAGGVEAPIAPGIWSAWCALRVLSVRNDTPEESCRPFSKDRDGFVLGEGAGIVILEELNFALKRGAYIYGEIIGYGCNSDAYHITFPSEKGNIDVMRRALNDAQISPENVDYINAHGTATLVNDKVETMAIKEVFGRDAYKIPISSTKSMIGHSLGASGAIEFITCILAIEKNILPPTINRKIFDPECDLDYITEGARKAYINVALSNSFGFGGNNAVLVIKRI